MDRRAFIKNGIGAMATLGLGELILLHPAQAQAFLLAEQNDFNRPSMGIKTIDNKRIPFIIKRDIPSKLSFFLHGSKCMCLPGRWR